jgi:hypothetical protein
MAARVRLPAARPLFKHHREVAALPPAEADALLDWCEETIESTARRDSPQGVVR